MNHTISLRADTINVDCVTRLFLQDVVIIRDECWKKMREWPVISYLQAQEEVAIGKGGGGYWMASGRGDD